jgi:2-methylcitrate dehydratase PrpD
MAAAAPRAIRIADFVAAMALDALPEGTRRGAGRRLLDTLGCALGASGAPPCSPASRPLRAGCAGGLGAALTQAARAGVERCGRDGETALDRTERHCHG